MPGDAALNRPAACLPAGLLLQRDAAFQGGLQASELLEDLDRALGDPMPVDPAGDLEFMDPDGDTLERGPGRDVGRAARSRPCPGPSPAKCGHEGEATLDRVPALVFERGPWRSLSEARKRHERSAVEIVLAGIDEDEDCINASMFSGLLSRSDLGPRPSRPSRRPCPPSPAHGHHRVAPGEVVALRATDPAPGRFHRPRPPLERDRHHRVQAVELLEQVRPGVCPGGERSEYRITGSPSRRR